MKPNDIWSALNDKWDGVLTRLRSDGDAARSFLEVAESCRFNLTLPAGGDWRHADDETVCQLASGVANAIRQTYFVN